MPRRSAQIVWGSNPRRTLVRGLIIAAITFVISYWILLPVRISGSSMEPTYQEGGLTFVNTLSYRFSTPARGDLVAVSLGSGRSFMFLKRVVALPGETIEIQDGQVIIDGSPLTEPYVKRLNLSWQMNSLKLGDDEVFVIGDNRDQEMSRHKLGRSQLRQIAGKVLF